MSLFVRIFLLFTMPVVLVQADDTSSVVRKIERNAEVILEEAKYSDAGPQDLKKALALVRRAKRVILGRSGSGPAGDGIDYKCVSRDNDNLAPYVLSYLGDDFNVVQVQGVLFRDLGNCEKINEDSRKFDDFSIACVARDDDNLAPWVMGRLVTSTLSKAKEIKFGAQAKCQEALENAEARRGGDVAFCRDRDGDGLAPYVISVINGQSGALSTKSDRFGSLAECQNLLN